MYCLDTLNLVGNPVINMHPGLADIRRDEDAIQIALNKYFGSASSGIPSLKPSGFTEQKLAASVKANPSQPLFGSTSSSNVGTYSATTRPAATSAVGAVQSGFSGSSGSSMMYDSRKNQQSKPSFLQNDSQADEGDLAQKIAQLELENRQLKMAGSTAGSTATTSADRDWRGGFTQPAARGGMMERPSTAAGNNSKVRDLENELKNERKQ